MASQKEQEWLDLYLETGEALEAVKIVFPDNAYPQARASQLKAKLKDEIEQALREQFQKDAPMALHKIRHLALGAKQESTQLKACQDILTRGGFNAVQETRELTEKPSEAELQARLKLALSGLDKETLASLMDGDTLKTIAQQATEDKPNDAIEH